jgi:hypothetical protein
MNLYNRAKRFPAKTARLVRSSDLSGTSRRRFIKSGAISASGLFLSQLSAGCGQGTVSHTDDNSIDLVVDYGRSFFCNTAEFNSVRMWIESRTIIINEKTGKEHVYYQGASCKSENTFGEKDLFYKDNYDFLPVFGDGKVLVFRRHANKRGDRYRTISDMEEMWGADPVIYTPSSEFAEELVTWEKIRDATAAGISIVSRTEFSDPGTGLKAVIECPVKTMNISHPKKMYQVDTGPVALPDLTKNYDVQIECLSLAFLAFNKNSFTDFVIETETPIIEGDKEVTTVYHYSKQLSLKTNNRLFALATV